MKTLIIVRHAKSSWDNLDIVDFERDLNKRGIENAPVIAKRIQEATTLPNLVLCSTAVRTRSTLALFEEKWGVQVFTEFVEALYMADSKIIKDTIRQFGGDSESVMLIGHNPGLTDFLNKYVNIQLDNLPTCGCIIAQFPISNWGNWKKEIGKMIFWEYPKRLEER